jgi:c-di-GMP-binding flagellar brake protein YcgR
MALLQELDLRQINEVLEQASQRQVPVTITVRLDNRWANYASRILAVRDEHVLLERPLGEPNLGQTPRSPGRQGGTGFPARADEDTAGTDTAWKGCATEPHEFAPAERIGLSFKLKHYKHVFCATVTGFGNMELPRAATALSDEAISADTPIIVPALVVCCPTRMQRLQRRAFLRAPVPPNRIVRASFWLGNWQDEPSGANTQTPVWLGAVSNISAGGLQILTDSGAARVLEMGDSVGVRLVFGAGDQTVYADAQFRHIEAAGDKTLIGFQFVGLAQTPQGRHALDLISRKVGEYHHIIDRARP